MQPLSSFGVTPISDDESTNSPTNAKRFGEQGFLDRRKRDGAARLWSVSLALLMTAEVCSMMSQDLQFSVHSMSTFYHALFPDRFHDDHRRRDTDVFHIYSISEARQVLQHAVEAYYRLPRESVDHFRVNAPARLHVTVLDPPPELADGSEPRRSLPRTWTEQTSEHLLTEAEPLGPLSNNSGQILRSLLELDLEMHWGALAGETGDFATFEWEVHLIWDFAHRGGRIDMFMLAAASLDDKGGRMIWLNVLLGICACASLLHSAGPWSVFKQLPMTPSSDARDRRTWWFHNCLRDVSLLAFVLLDFHCMHSPPPLVATPRSHLTKAKKAHGRFASRSAPEPMQQYRRSALSELLVWLELYHGVHVIRSIAALGIFLAWICVCETAPREPQSLLWRILTTALPPVVSFLWASLPIYIGFAALGLVLFAEHAPLKFGSLLASSASLFSLLNGDVLMETILDIEPAGMVVSRVYVSSFICVFVFVVLNGVLCLIQDVFRQAKAIC